MYTHQTLALLGAILLLPNTILTAQNCGCADANVRVSAFTSEAMSEVRLNGQSVQQPIVVDLKVGEVKEITAIYVGSEFYFTIEFPHCGIQFQVPETELQLQPTVDDWKDGDQLAGIYNSGNSQKPEVTGFPRFWIRLNAEKCPLLACNNKPGGKAEVAGEGGKGDAANKQVLPAQGRIAMPMGGVPISDTHFMSAGKLTARGEISHDLAKPAGLTWDHLDEVSALVDEQTPTVGGTEERHLITDSIVLRLRGWDASTSSAVNDIDTALESQIEVYEAANYNPTTRVFSGTPMSSYELQKVGTAGVDPGVKVVESIHGRSYTTTLQAPPSQMVSSEEGLVTTIVSVYDDNQTPANENDDTYMQTRTEKRNGVVVGWHEEVYF